MDVRGIVEWIRWMSGTVVDKMDVSIIVDNFIKL